MGWEMKAAQLSSEVQGRLLVLVINAPLGSPSTGHGRRRSCWDLVHSFCPANADLILALLLVTCQLCSYLPLPEKVKSQ